jgi:CRP-like cAMP-binding protein
MANHDRSRTDPSPVRPGELVAKQVGAKRLVAKRAAAKQRVGANRPFDPATFLTTDGAGRKISKYRKEQAIFSQGDTANELFYIIRGTVKLVVHSEQGKEAIIAILGQDEFFGEGCLAGQPHRLSAASAITEGEILRITKSAAMSVLREQPSFSEMFVSHVVSRTMRVEADLIDQLFNSSEKRLARALLLLANFGNDGKPQRIITRVSQEMLADMIGTTRSRVSHFMNKFRKLGFIDYNGHLEIRSALLNVVLHEQPHISSVKSTKRTSERKTD